jgi:RimJ/RimL family protein N-acetyltransferase
VAGRGEAVTERLRCVRPGAADVGDYRRLFGHPEVGRWLRPPPLEPMSVAAIDLRFVRDRADWDEHGFGPWVLRERQTGRFVGRAGLAWITVEGEPMVELPWAVLPGWQGRGYATEAALAAVETARGLGLDRVISLTLPGNRASLRVMEKAGLSRVGPVDHAGLPHVLFELNLSRASG